MLTKKKWILAVLVFACTLIFAVPANAADFKTVRTSKARYGSYYVWRPYNTVFYIQKVGSGKVRKISKSCYTLWGVTNGNDLWFTQLAGKYNGEVSLYKYNLSTAKLTKRAVIKNALHIQGLYKGLLYGNSASASTGRSNNCVYKYNLGKNKKTIILRNFFVERANERYLFGWRNGVKYCYNVANGRLARTNWKNLN